MLNVLRRSAASWVAKILFGLLILSFAAWGIGDYVRPDPNRPVATVGGTPISPAQFSEAYRQEYERWNQRFGGRLSREMATQLGLPEQVVRQLVVRRLIEIEARTLGIAVGDDQVRAAIIANPMFRGADGGFDRGRFARVLQGSGLSEAGYVAGLRDEMGLEQLVGSIGAEVRLPAGMVTALYRFHEEKRSASVLLVPDSAVTDVAPPSDTELAEFHAAHKDRFMAPEYRALTLLVLDPNDIMATTRPTDDEVRAAYEARLSDFRVPGTRMVSQLLFPDEAAARDAYARLSVDQDFDSVATALAAVAPRTDLGRVKRGELFPRQVEDAAFALTAPGVTAPVQSPLGWHVLRVTEIEPERAQTLAEVRDALATEMAREAATDRMRTIGNTIEDRLAGGATLEEAAGEAGAKTLKIAAVDRDGHDPSGNTVPGLPIAPVVLPAAFDAPQGQETPLAETGDGGYFSVRVDGITPSVLKPLESIRAEVAAAWRAERVRERARVMAEDLAERVRKGETLAQVAGAAKLTVKTPAAVQRTANLPADGLPATVVQKIFATPKGGVAVAPAPGGHVVAVVESIEAPDPAQNADAVKQWSDRLAGGLAGDLESQFTKALEARIGVQIDQAALRRNL